MKAKPHKLPATALVCAIGLGAVPTHAFAEESTAELAMELANPVAALISVPFQLNYNQKIGPTRSGTQWTLNIQPVVPFSLNTDWNLISRTIVPIVSQKDIFPGAGSQSGLGDTVQSVFFSPKAPTAGGWIWGAGPVLLLPTGTDELTSTKKWGAGPTAVMLKQENGWTYGALANHIWSFAGDSGRPDISATFLQPFLSYSTPTALTLVVQSESTYDYKNKQWSVPINLIASQILRIDQQLISVGGGVRYWAEAPDSGPHGWGLRLTVTLLFPR